MHKLHYIIYIPPQVIKSKYFMNLRDKDNLRRKDKSAVPKVSFVRRFHCSWIIHLPPVQYYQGRSSSRKGGRATAVRPKRLTCMRMRKFCEMLVRSVAGENGACLGAVISGVLLTASAHFFRYLLSLFSLPPSRPRPLPWNDYVDSVSI